MAARLAKADLTTDMVREFTELQGVMGGIYAARKASRKRSGRRSTFTICRSASRPTRRRRAQLGKAAVTWAAVSLADKLDTIVGLFAAGEKPTGSRDPYGLRRAAQGVVKILVDLDTWFGVIALPRSIVWSIEAFATYRRTRRDR